MYVYMYMCACIYFTCIFSSFRFLKLYCALIYFLNLSFKGIDLPESDDPRVIVQNIMFSENKSILAPQVMDVVCMVFVFCEKLKFQSTFYITKISDHTFTISEKVRVCRAMGGYVVERS